MHEQLCLYYANIVVLLPAAPGRLPPRQKTSNPHATVQQMTKEFERVARARSAKDEENLRRVADWLAELLVSPCKGAASQVNLANQPLVLRKAMRMSCVQVSRRIRIWQSCPSYGHC